MRVHKFQNPPNHRFCYLIFNLQKYAEYAYSCVKAIKYMPAKNLKHNHKVNYHKYLIFLCVFSCQKIYLQVCS